MAPPSDLCTEFETLSKTGSLPLPVVREIGSSPLSMELLTRMMDIGNKLADVKTSLVEYKLETTTHLGKQDQQLAELGVVVKDIKKDTGLHNGRLKTIEEWRAQMDKERIELEALRHETQERIKVQESFRKGLFAPLQYAWKSLAWVFVTVVFALNVGEETRSFMHFIVSLLQHKP